MKRTTLAVTMAVTVALAGWLIAAQPKSKAPEQGYVPEGWYPHEGGLMKYRVNIRFGEEPDTMPEGWKFGRVSAVTIDEQDEVYVFHRGPKADPLMVFDSKGNYLRSWGRGMFGNPHGMRIGPDGNIWCVDNGEPTGHEVHARRQAAADSGDQGRRSAPTKHISTVPPTSPATADGDFYVSDGYGNSRVVKFTKDGKYLMTWGKPGTGPGEFNTPHAIAVDSKGRVYVSDRENNRIQIFTPRANSSAVDSLRLHAGPGSSPPMTRCG